MKLYATCQYKCGDNKQINCNYNCHLGHDNMATGGGYYTNDTTNSPSPSSIYSSCPQLSQYRSLPRNLFSALRRQQYNNAYLQQQPSQQQQQQQQYTTNCVQSYALSNPRTNSEQELRRSALIKSISNQNNKKKNLILCSKCAV